MIGAVLACGILLAIPLIAKICLLLDFLDKKHCEYVEERGEDLTVGRGFEVTQLTGTPARVDTKKDDHHG